MAEVESALLPVFGQILARASVLAMQSSAMPHLYVRRAISSQGACGFNVSLHGRTTLILFGLGVLQGFPAKVSFRGKSDMSFPPQRELAKLPSLAAWLAGELCAV